MSNHFDLETIKSAVDLRMVMRSRGITERAERFECRCKPESSPTIAIYGDGHRWRCFRCNSGGSIVDLLVHLDGLTVPAAIRASAALAGVISSGPRTRVPEPTGPTQREITSGIFRHLATLRDNARALVHNERLSISERAEALALSVELNRDLDAILHGSDTLRRLTLEVWS